MHETLALSAPNRQIHRRKGQTCTHVYRPDNSDPTHRLTATNFEFLFVRWIANLTEVHLPSFFFNDTATTETYTCVYTLSLHDALPISRHLHLHRREPGLYHPLPRHRAGRARSEEHTSELQSQSHISYAVFCLKKNSINSSLLLMIKRLLLVSFLSMFALSSRAAAPAAGEYIILVGGLFFFQYEASTEFYTCDYTLSLHDALPI